MAASPRSAKRSEPPPKAQKKTAARAGTPNGGGCADKKPDASHDSYASQRARRKSEARYRPQGFGEAVSNSELAKLKLEMADLLNKKSLRQCGRTLAPSARRASVLLTVEKGKARTLGLMRCKNPHICPSCGRWLATDRAAQLRPQLLELEGEHTVTALVTLTIERNLGFSLADQAHAIDAAWRNVTKGARFDRWKAQAGGLAFVRGQEIGYAFTTGWGSHMHLVMMLLAPRWPSIQELALELNLHRKAGGQSPLGRKSAELLAQAEQWLRAIMEEHETAHAYLLSWFTRRFRDEVRAQGFHASSRGQEWQVAESEDAVLGYISKGAAGWDALAEAVCGIFKTQGLLSVWDLLKIAQNEKGPKKAKAAALVREYAEATRGRRALTTSRNLNLRPDDEAMEMAPDTKTEKACIELTDEALKTLRRSPGGIGLARLLDAIPRLWGDRPATERLLTVEHGIDPLHWRWSTLSHGPEISVPAPASRY